ITAGGFAEAYDELGDDPAPPTQLGDSSDPRVSKTS
ncbi:GtrA family protein, partial [Mycobacterium sp. CBMA361]|nr:GtrA family protein [Mycolicibacterium sp. CBMA 361]